MKKALTNNLGLKLLSLFFAFAVWLVVVNIDDPVISNTYSGVVVEVINDNTLLDKGKVYEILNNSDVIDVTITGKRSIVESISKENIKALADLQDMSLMNAVEIKLSTNKNNDQLDAIKSSTASLQLKIEDLKELHLPINILVDGEPADDYIAGDAVTNQNTVRVSGPESIIDEIVTAQAEVSVSGRTNDITTNCDIKLYDKDGAPVESQYINTNIKNVNISVAILPVKAVEIECGYVGEPANGYLVDGEPQSDRQAVYIAGKQSLLDSISTIVVPESVIDITDAKDNCSATVDINRYIPEGVRLAEDSFGGKITITVPVAKSVERSFDVQMSNLVLVNIPNGYEAEILLNSNNVNPGDEENNITMKINTKGILHEYDLVDEDKIKGYVDVEGYMQETGVQAVADGIYRLPIEFNLPDNIIVNETYYAEVKIISNANGL